jgi:membrane protease YdiL (CAAX protease family)
LIVLFYIICFLALGVLETVAQLLFSARVTDSREALFQWLSLASVALATWVVLRKIDKRSWSSIGLGRDALRLPAIIAGGLLGGLTIGIASLLLLASHMMRVDPAPAGSWWGEATHGVLVLLPAAFFEELFIRGYVFGVIRRLAGWRLALITTSVVFGLLHVWNPGADPETILAVIVAGFFLGAILLATKSLYAAGAAHFAWNWVMAGALHIAVSGLPSVDVDYRTVETGPDWLTGGPWGPEGGLAAVALMFVAIFYLYGRYLRRMEWRA